MIENMNNSPIKQVMVSKYHEHNVLIYKNIEQFAEIYSSYAKANLGTEIILIATHYETPDKVKENITAKGVDVDKFEKEGLL